MVRGHHGCRKTAPSCRKNALPAPGGPNRLESVTETLMPRPDQLNAFFTAAPAGLAILDGSLRYVQLNETLALMNGPSVAEHLGKSVREVLPELALRLEPMLQRILATREPALNIEVTAETPAQPGVTRYWMASEFALSNPSRRAHRTRAIVV